MRGSRIVVLTAALMLLTSGCWLEAGQSAGRAGFNPFESQITAANVSQLGVAWQHQLTGPIHESLISPSSATTYVPGAGALTSYDLGTGTSHWSNTSMPGSFQPMLSGNQVLVAGPGTANCVVMHVDTSTGSLASTDTYGETIGGSSVACGPGTPLGTNRVVVPWSQTAVGGNSTCAPQSTWRQFYGLTSLPGFQFQQELSIVCSDTQPPLPPLPFGTPSQVGQLIIVPTSENLDNVQTFDATTGQLGWSAFGGGTINGPVIGLPNGDIAWTTTNGLLVVHNGTTGAFKWSAQLDTTLALPPAASQTTIFVVTPSGALDALPVGGCNATTCSPVWHATLASPASVRPSIGGNVVYVGSNDGSVTAFAAGGCNASTCSSLWSGSTGSKVTGAPAIGQGAVVVGSDDGTVTAFRLQPQS